MPTTTDSFLRTMQTLGSPDELDALAAEGLAPDVRPLVNAHVHLPPNFTAFETITQAVEMADAQNVRVLGATNYYDYSIYTEFAAKSSRHGIFPLFGLEIITLVESLVQMGVKINDPGNPGKYYLCGKGITRFDPLPEEARQLLQVIRDNDAARMSLVTEKMAAVFAQAGLGTGLDAEAVKERIVRRHGSRPETVYLQERHVAQAFQESLFEQVDESDRGALLQRAFGTASKAQPGDAVAIQNEIRSHLMKAGKPAYVTETFVDFDHAYRLILALGGIPCYPTLADGTTPITGYEQPVENLIADLKARGIPCAELIPIRNTPVVLSQYVHAMRDAGLFVTAGTEHNTLDLLPLAPTCLGGEPIPDDIQEIFWEGACVVAAHQYMTMNGRSGFAGDIKGFQRLGAAVITRYGEKNSQGS